MQYYADLFFSNVSPVVPITHLEDYYKVDGINGFGFNIYKQIMVISVSKRVHLPCTNIGRVTSIDHNSKDINQANADFFVT